MKIAVLLWSPAISGGTYVIFEHMSRNKQDDIYIVTEQKVNKKDIAWHKGAEKLQFITYKQAKHIKFDVAIATWWRTVYELYRINAKKYIYFVQSIESRFYSDIEKNIKWLVDATYLLPIDIITEAKWIKKYLELNYGRDVELVPNGIRKDLYKVEGNVYKKPQGLRVLVEGPVNVDFKNVPKTIDLVNQSLVDEIWLLTSSDIKEYKGVDRVFSRVPIDKVAKIYRSCDVIVKLSYVEGMFGPPLEMFHCGGTAIVYDVTGHDEYIVNKYNGLVVKTDDDKNVVKAINKLKNNPKFLDKLKRNAQKTANDWIDWDNSAKVFKEAVHKIYNKKGIIKQEHLKKAIHSFFEINLIYENKQVSLKKEIVIRLKHGINVKINFLKRIVKNILKKAKRC